jgi:ribonuclease HI
MSRNKPEVILYTDGACSGNPGPGGWGALLKYNDREKTLSGGETHTTNNRMEMKAVIEGLKALNKPCHVKIHSDSALIINAFTKGWIESWKKRGWKKSNKKPVENRELWEAIIAAGDPHTLEWIKVKGHSDNVLNNRVDALAVEASQRYK